MRTNRRFPLSIAALFVAVAATACTDSSDPVGVPHRVSLPIGPSRLGVPVSSAIEFVDGEGKLDVTDVQIEFPEGFTVAAPIVVTGNYKIKSVPECGGCKVTAYIGFEFGAEALPDGATFNSVLAETDGTTLPVVGAFKWTSRVRKTGDLVRIGAGQMASAAFTPTTPGRSGVLNLLTGEVSTQLSLMWEQVSLPGIFPTVTGTANAAGWYRTDVNVSWDVVYTYPVDNSKTGCDPVVLTADTEAKTTECSATSFRSTSTRSVTIKRDATPPTISDVAITPPPNASGWRNSNVTVTWKCSDETSKPLNLSGSQTFALDGAKQSAMATCTDNADNTATQGINGINIDKTAPTLSPTVSVNPVVQNGSATASPNASDVLSGIESASCDPVVTSQVGTFSVTCQATDNAGNTATKSVSYVVTSPFNFSGFQSPIVPGTLNSRNAGAAVPVKFSVGGNKGLNILAAGFPTSRLLTCPAGATVTTATETTTSSNGGGLQYDASSDTYTYVWKTEKAWAGTCRTLVLKLTDGIERTADFQFKK